MKKYLCLLLILMFTFIFSSICFAAGEEMPEDPNPEGGDLVTVDVYNDPVPEGFDVKEDNVPASGELVQTGGIPAGLFYGVGGLCIVAALVISRKKTKETTNH